jgi:hypothetical protein
MMARKDKDWKAAVAPFPKLSLKEKRESAIGCRINGAKGSGT